MGKWLPDPRGGRGVFGQYLEGIFLRLASVEIPGSIGSLREIRVGLSLTMSMYKTTYSGGWYGYICSKFSIRGGVVSSLDIYSRNIRLKGNVICSSSAHLESYCDTIKSFKFQPSPRP